MMATQEYSQLSEVLAAAKRSARDLRQAHFGAGHLLFAALERNSSLSKMLEAWGKEHGYIREWAEVRMESEAKADLPVEFPEADLSAEKVLEEAEKVRLRIGGDWVDPFCLFVAAITPGIAWSLPQLKALPISDQEAMSLMVSRPPVRQDEAEQALFADEPGLAPTPGGIPYCRPISSEYTSKGRHTIGREGELRQMDEVLHRKQSTGILVVGDSGVGKTALLQAFAHALELDAKGDEPRVYHLEVAKLITGCAHNGEIEARLGKALEKLRKRDRPILFIDDLHILLEDKGGGNNVVHTLNAALAEGGLALVATIVTESYTKKIESNEALLRKLELVRVYEPDNDTSLKCLEVHQPNLEKHHGISLADSALEEASKLAQRYFKERKMPDAGIQLLDRTLSSSARSNKQASGIIQRLKTEFAQLHREWNQEQLEEKSLPEFRWLRKQLFAQLSPVLLGQLENDTDPEELRDAASFQLHLEALFKELELLAAKEIKSVSSVEVAAMVAHQTGIPIGKIQSQERMKLLHLQDHLRKRVIGQNQAIDTLADAIIESRSGLGEKGKPIGSFFFLGPTGTGKTELAKTLAEFLFNDEQSMIRFDMSEFKEEHSAALLYGAPPGYVGYEEGGLLVNKIRQKPYSVVLFDEIEKAHPSVYDIFLQIMDEGHIHDRLGKKGSFVDAIVIFTSNIGSDWIAEQFRSDQIPASNQLTEIMARHFRPEFLGRLTEVVPFGPITLAVALKIFDLQLNRFKRILEAGEIELTLSEEAKTHLAQQGFSDRYGARPIAGVIRTQIRRPISKMMTQGDVDQGSHLFLDLDGEGQLVWTDQHGERRSPA